MEGQAQEAMSSTTLASFASYCVEFTRLSQLTGDPKYYDAVARITDELDKVQNITKIPGLWPNKMNGATIEFTGNVYSFAAQGDSAYEYLNKVSWFRHMMSQSNFCERSIFYSAIRPMQHSTNVCTRVL